MSLDSQVSSAVRAAILEGVLKDGDRLPAARQLAKTLGINMHTVLRGYQQLRDEGLIELRRGRGARVVESGLMKERERITSILGKFVTEARALGVSDVLQHELLRSVQRRSSL
ncbi:GntR family transcriptional regulator [Streptomyces violascens]|uniref:GntR family transcriptional regulator n=1 Tax=Streptomyces violascens TaxID=67381 RepID=UPI0037AF6A1E